MSDTAARPHHVPEHLLFDFDIHNAPRVGKTESTGVCHEPNDHRARHRLRRILYGVDDGQHSDTACRYYSISATD